MDILGTKTLVIDIDGTICTQNRDEYSKAEPYKKRIAFINNLYEHGHIIKYYTARGSTSGKDWTELTRNQLKEWGAKYHELIMGKPHGDMYIDDKGFGAPMFFGIRGIGK